MKVTFEDLIQEYCDTGHLDSIPDFEGVYVVYLPDKFSITIKQDSDALKSPRKPYDIERLKSKLEIITQDGLIDNNVVYIGKADDLRKRTRQFIRFGMGLGSNHAGGRALWQIENNKKLLFEYTICPGSRVRENEMLLDFKSRHGDYPLANFRK